MNTAKQLTSRKSVRETITAIISFGIIGGGVIAVAYMIFIGANTPSAPPKPYVPDQIELHIQAQQFVLQALKSPSTAKFPTFPNEALSLGDGAYRVSSYVDSQNSFGAMIRSAWTVKMFLVEGHWFLDHMTIDGKVVYDATNP